MSLRDLPLDPTGESEVELLLAVQTNTTRRWRGELGRAGKQALRWCARPGGHSIGAVLLHMADVELYWIREFAAGLTISPERLELLLSQQIEQYAGRWPVPPVRSLADYYEIQDEVRRETSALVRGLGPSTLPVGPGDRALTLRQVLAHVIQHEAYHGGQAVLLYDLYRHQRR